MKKKQTKQNKTKQRRPELIKEKKIQVVILVTSPGLFENVQKERNRKKREAKIRDSNIAINWHSYGKRMMQ